MSGRKRDVFLHVPLTAKEKGAVREWAEHEGYAGMAEAVRVVVLREVRRSAKAGK